MNKFARLPANEATLRTASAEARRARRTHYFAFLSYSHKDRALADWLQRELEGFRVPSSLAGRLTDNGVVPRRLVPIFRDEHDLAAAHDLGHEIQEALTSSQFLIVLCSPSAAQSRWTNAEVELFKRTRPDACVLAAIASGEPFASDVAGREAEECFPPALRQKYDRRGRPTGKRAEPLAADFRGSTDERRLAFLKLVAGMLDVPLDELVQRETTRRQRRLAWLAAASLGGMAVTSTLAITAIQSRNEAREQRREAEGLVAFMLGDLKDKLEPIGRLDALDGVGTRVLSYYSKQDMGDLSDAALMQRARALSLMGQVAFSRGELDKAEQLYREAATGTGEAMRRDPSDAQRLYEHAQNIFYLGYVAAQHGRLDQAEAHMREYKRLASGMVALEPDNMKWRMESEDADVNLGAVLYDRRRFAESAAQLRQALQTMQALTTANPSNKEYPKSLAETLAWLADAELSSGNLAGATQHRRQHVALLERLAAAPASDVSYREKLVAARLKLATLLGAQAQDDAAEREARAAVETADDLIRREPANATWLDLGAASHLQLAQLLLANGRSSDAVANVTSGCDYVRRLFSRPNGAAEWRIDEQGCFARRAQLALAGGNFAEASGWAARALTSARAMRGGDRIADRYTVAQTQLLIGDIASRRGDQAGARAAWTAGLSLLPGNIQERPGETAIRAALLKRLGDAARVRQLDARLTGLGVRRPDLLV